eukprot:3737637-Lingulodinium_polyedra.AAC.1
MVLGDIDGPREFRLLASRATQHQVEAYLTHLGHSAEREGGVLEWHTQILWPGGMPGMTGAGIE